MQNLKIMTEQTLPQSVTDCLTGWCLTEQLLSRDERDLLMEAADYKYTRYAIVEKVKLEGLQKLGLLFIAHQKSPECQFLFRNGAFPFVSMAQDFLEDKVIFLFFRDKDIPKANKMWDRFFKEDEFQPMYNGLVSLICRAIASRRPFIGLDDAQQPLHATQEDFDLNDLTHQLYLTHIQIASVQIYG